MCHRGARQAKEDHERALRKWMDERSGLTARAESLEKGLAACEASAKARAGDTAKVQTLLDQAREENDSLRFDVQTAQRAVVAQRTETKNAREAAEHLRKQLDAECGKRKRAEDDRDLAKRRAKAARTARGGGGGELDDGMDKHSAQQLKLFQSIVMCPTCPDQFKSHCITRCGHVLSEKAVDERLKSRNRKCPVCGTVFAATDVIPVHLV